MGWRKWRNVKLKKILEIIMKFIVYFLKRESQCATKLKWHNGLVLIVESMILNVYIAKR
jgi:hypothetical protein